ncbi:MAG: MATE family efflux transporter [Robiginitomaculum sp.]
MTDISAPADSRYLTRKSVALQAWPIMIANSAGPIVGLVDTGVIGQLGDKTALAGIGLGAVIYAIFYWGFGFLRMSTAGLAAQAVGAKDEGALQAHLMRAVPLGVFIGLIVLAAQALLLGGVFAIYTAGEAVEQAARTYLSIRLWGLPATLGGIALMGWFIGIGRPRRALYMQIGLNIINAALSLWFVLGLNMGIAGVATASVIAEIFGLIIGLWLARAEIITRGGWRREALTRKALTDRAALSKLGVTNSNIFIRTLALTLGFNFFTWQAANQGETFLAGNHVLLQFINMIALVLDSFAHVAEAAVGAAYGARDKLRFKRAVRLTSEFSAIAALLACAAVFLLGPYIIDFLTTEPQVRASAKTYLPYCALAPIAGFAAWQLDGIFIGVTATAPMRNAGIVAVIIYIGVHFALYPLLGAHGIWIAFLLYYIARALTLAVGYPKILRDMERFRPCRPPQPRT